MCWEEGDGREARGVGLRGGQVAEGLFACASENAQPRVGRQVSFRVNEARQSRCSAVCQFGAARSQQQQEFDRRTRPSGEARARVAAASAFARRRSGSLALAAAEADPRAQALPRPRTARAPRGPTDPRSGRTTCSCPPSARVGRFERPLGSLRARTAPQPVAATSAAREAELKILPLSTTSARHPSYTLFLLSDNRPN